MFRLHNENAGETKGNFDASTLTCLLEGGESAEPAIIPGDAQGSILYQAVMWDGYEMPPKENDRRSRRNSGRYWKLRRVLISRPAAERTIPTCGDSFLTFENLASFAGGIAHVERMLKFAVDEKERLLEQQETAAKVWFAEHDLPYNSEQEHKDLDDELKPPRNAGLTTTEQRQLRVREQDKRIWTRRLERYQPMAQSVYLTSCLVEH